MTISPAFRPLLEASPSLETLLTAADRAAGTEAPVLILGEEATGRSTLARAIHAASPRRSGPLLEVDISALPSSLFESEMFGFRAGAFTGAERATAGRVEQARGGTLVLDHVEEIPLPSQPKLLRLLAEKRYAPLGDREVEIDVRFLGIAAEDLPQRLESGRFRTDLFYRLEVINLRVPPVRERMEDIPTLVATLLRDLRQRMGLDAVDLSSASRAWMESYSWPGNLREMRNVLERALVLWQGGPLETASTERTAEAPVTLAELERTQIRRALAYTRGHQGRAAALLGISRKTLWQKRKRYGIP